MRKSRFQLRGCVALSLLLSVGIVSDAYSEEPVPVPVQAAGQSGQSAQPSSAASTVPAQGVPGESQPKESTASAGSWIGKDAVRLEGPPPDASTGFVRNTPTLIMRMPVSDKEDEAAQATIPESQEAISKANSIHQQALEFYARKIWKRQ